MSKALQNIRVIDFTQGMWGSLGSAFLGDFGAEVIKLETLEGDPYRKPELIESLPKADWNYHFEYCNRNKKSIAVDLERDEGVEMVRRLVGSQ